MRSTAAGVSRSACRGMGGRRGRTRSRRPRPCGRWVCAVVGWWLLGCCGGGGGWVVVVVVVVC